MCSYLQLADFGFARQTPHSTVMQTVCGTRCYQAPELLRLPFMYTRKVDTWSVGVIMYEWWVMFISSYILIISICFASLFSLCTHQLYYFFRFCICLLH